MHKIEYFLIFHSFFFRYAYLPGLTSASNFENTLAKLDLKTGEFFYWRGDEYHFPGEALFLPNPESNDENTNEDDGVVMSIVMDSSGISGGFLLLLDAKTFQEIARAYFKARVPFLIHGMML